MICPECNTEVHIGPDVFRLGGGEMPCPECGEYTFRAGGPSNPLLHFLQE